MQYMQKRKARIKIKQLIDELIKEKKKEKAHKTGVNLKLYSTKNRDCERINSLNSSKKM